MDKRKFLYYNLYRIENKKRDIFSDYIKTNEIEHSENSNGILLNLSKIDSKHIDFLYDLLQIQIVLHSLPPSLPPRVVGEVSWWMV